MHYYGNEELQLRTDQKDSEISQLTGQLSSILRTIGHEEFLDVRKIVIPRSRTQSNIPPTSKYFEDADFYALSPQSDWVYSKSTEIALVQEMTGQDLSKSKLFQLAGNISPIHLWREKRSVHIVGSPIKVLFPFVYVERLPVEKVESAIGSLAQDAHPEQMVPSDEKSPAIDPELAQLFRGDIAGKFLVMYLVGTLTTSGNDIYELLNVQKVDNVVYVAIRRTLLNVKIDQVEHSRY